MGSSKNISPEKCGDSERPELSVVSRGAKSSIPPVGVGDDESRPTTWQAVRTLLVDAFEVCKHPAFDQDELLTERDRARARRAAITDAKAKVGENPAIFDLWCRRAETLARADEVRFFVECEMLHPDDEESRLITLAWLNLAGQSGEREFCEDERLSQIDLRRHVRRCCAAIVRQLALEPTRKPAPLDHLRERDTGYRGEPVVAAGRSYPGNDRGERLRFYDGARDNGERYAVKRDELKNRFLTSVAGDAEPQNGLVFGIEEIASELRRTVISTRRKIDRRELPVAEFFGQLCAHRALLRPFRERHSDRHPDRPAAA